MRPQPATHIKMIKICALFTAFTFACNPAAPASTKHPGGKNLAPYYMSNPIVRHDSAIRSLKDDLDKKTTRLEDKELFLVNYILHTINVFMQKNSRSQPSANLIAAHINDHKELFDEQLGRPDGYADDILWEIYPKNSNTICLILPRLSPEAPVEIQFHISQKDGSIRISLPSSENSSTERIKELKAAHRAIFIRSLLKDVNVSEEIKDIIKNPEVLLTLSGIKPACSVDIPWKKTKTLFPQIAKTIRERFSGRIGLISRNNNVAFFDIEEVRKTAENSRNTKAFDGAPLLTKEELESIASDERIGGYLEDLLFSDNLKSGLFYGYPEEAVTDLIKYTELLKASGILLEGEDPLEIDIEDPDNEAHLRARFMGRDKTLDFIFDFYENALLGSGEDDEINELSALVGFGWMIRDPETQRNALRDYARQLNYITELLEESPGARVQEATGSAALSPLPQNGLPLSKNEFEEDLVGAIRATDLTGDELYFILCDVDRLNNRNIIYSKGIIGTTAEPSDPDIVYSSHSIFRELLLKFSEIAASRGFQSYRYLSGDEFTLLSLINDPEEISRRLNDIRLDLTAYFNDKYGVGRISKDALDENEIKALAEHKDVLSISRYGDWYHILIRREKDISLVRQLEDINLNISGNLEAFPMNGGIIPAFTLSIGAVPASKVASELSLITGRDILDSSGRVAEELSGDLSRWGMRLANDALQSAKKTRNSVFLAESLSSFGPAKQDRPIIKPEKKGPPAPGIDSLTGFHEMNAFRENKKSKGTLLLMEVDTYNGKPSREDGGLHAINQALGYESTNEVISILARSLEKIVKDSGYDTAVFARGPPDKFYISIDADISGDRLRDILDRVRSAALEELARIPGTIPFNGMRLSISSVSSGDIERSEKARSSEHPFLFSNPFRVIEIISKLEKIADMTRGSMGNSVEYYATPAGKVKIFDPQKLTELEKAYRGIQEEAMDTAIKETLRQNLREKGAAANANVPEPLRSRERTAREIALKRSAEEEADVFIRSIIRTLDKHILSTGDANGSIMIGVDAGWIPQEIQDSLMNGLIRNLNRKEKFRNIIIHIERSGKDLSRILIDEKIKNNIPLCNIVIVGSPETLRDNSFNDLRKDRNNSALFAHIKTPETTDPLSFIRLLKVLSLAVDLSRGDVSLSEYADIPFKKEESGGYLHYIIDLPKPELLPLDLLKEIYEIQSRRVETQL
jgi:hypothetical protein